MSPETASDPSVHQLLPTHAQAKGRGIHGLHDESRSASAQSQTLNAAPAGLGGRWRRVGFTGCLILSLGTAVALAVPAFLAALWSEAMAAADGKEAASAWIFLLAADRATRVVTVCTAALRTSVTLQAGLMTAMAAGIVLEKTRPPLLHAPALSIIRAVGTGPTNLLHTMLPMPRGLLSVAVYAVVVVEVLLVVASQFFSTILLADFSNAGLMGAAAERNVTSYLTVEAYHSAYWSNHPAGWVFAETGGSFDRGSNFDDTGPTYRAFLPFADEQERNNLRSFSGPALVMNQRVLCLRPRLSNMTLSDGWLTGSLDLDEDAHPSLRDANKSSSHFTIACTLRPIHPESRGVDASVICLPETAIWNFKLNDSLPDIQTLHGHLDEYRTDFTAMAVVLQAVSPSSIEAHLGNFPIEDPAVHRLPHYRDDGSWTVIGNASTKRELLKATACMSGLGVDAYNVKMDREWPGSEPSMAWQTDRIPNAYDTRSTRRQLGASLSPAGLRERGLLRLNPREDWKVIRLDDADEREQEQFRYQFYMDFVFSLPKYDSRQRPAHEAAGDRGNWTRHLGYNHINSLDRGLWTLFKDVLADTDSPALALQALLAKINQQRYYSRLAQQAPTRRAQVALAADTLMPARRAGLVAVVVVVVVHLALVAVVTAVFVASTKVSSVGNAWQAVAQVVSEDTMPLLGQADRMTDSGVERWLSDDAGRGTYASLRRRGDGRVAVGMEEKGQ